MNKDPMGIYEFLTMAGVLFVLTMAFMHFAGI